MKSALVLTLLVACAPSAAIRAAERGDGVTLERVARGMSQDEAARVARLVAERDVRSASAAQAPARVHELWACAHELDDVLADRMKLHDQAGAEAALARLDAGGLSLDDARAHLDDPDPYWRAVGVRGLVRAGDHAARARALLDVDPHVRRQAARAARDAADPSDLSILADAARVDPEPIVRTEAVRAIAVLSSLPSEAAADVLRDLWPTADDGLQEDIALAWSRAAVWRSGGEEALRNVVSSEDGPGALEGAAAVLRRSDARGEIVRDAQARLLRALQDGPRAERLQAIAEAAEGPELREALRAALDDDDLDVRVSVLARLAQAHEPRAREKLEALATGDSGVALRARFALASMGDVAVESGLERALRSERPSERLAAATALASLNRAARAAPLLADPDPQVRTRVACTILLASRVH